MSTKPNLSQVGELIKSSSHSRDARVCQCRDVRTRPLRTICVNA